MPERKLEWVHESRQYVFEKVNKVYETIRRVMVHYGAQSANHAKKGIMNAFLRTDVFEVQSKMKTIQNTDFSPMTKSSLSFFDDYRILSGIPVFVLKPSDYVDQVDGVFVSSSSSPYAADSTIQNPSPRESRDVTCSSFSADVSLFVSGHQDGVIMVWDAEHGKLKKILTGKHHVAIADVVFYKNSSRFLLACDFSGVMSVWDLEDSSKEPVIVNCSGNWEKTRMPSVEGHWPQLCRQGKLLVCPVQVVLEKLPNQQRGPPTSRRVFSISSMGKMDWARGGTMSKLGRHGGVFAHFCILHIFDTRAEGITRDDVFGDDEGKTYCWGSQVDLPSMTKLYVPLVADSHDYALSSTEISHDSRGLLIGVSSRPDGHLIVWPDFRRRPIHSYRLDGMVGRWSPCSKFIASWDSPLKNTLRNETGVCRVWRLEEILETADRCQQNGDGDHPRFTCKASTVLQCPSGNPIYWCDFVSLAPATGEQPKRDGVATCSVGEQVQLVLWDFENGIPVQTFCPGICARDITLHTQQAWADKWVLVKPSWGLNFVSVSADRTRLGFVSIAANKGIIYDTEKRIERLWISLSDKNGAVDETLRKDMDLIMSPNGDRFVTLCEDTIMVWLPQVLQIKEERGASWTSLQSSDGEIEDGKLRCKFSSDGHSIGLMRLYCSVMDIWNLRTGHKTALRQELVEQNTPVNTPLADDDTDDMSSYPGTPLSVLSPKTTVSAARERWFCQFCISRNGDQVATCMGDMSVLLWDLTTSPPTASQIATLDSRYCAAWAVCFVEGPAGQPDYVVVCEDTGNLVWIRLHPHPRFVARRDAEGKKRCTFSADGRRAVLMPDDIQVRVWDLVERVEVFRCTYHVWLGKSGLIPFPHNIAMDGQSALIGLDTTREAVRCGPDTTYADLKALSEEKRPCLVPQNLAVNEDLTWFATEELLPFDFDSSERPKLGQKNPRVNSAKVPSVTSSNSLKGSTSSGASRRSRSAKVTFTGDGETTRSDFRSQFESRETEGYPNIRERLSNEHLWDYLRADSLNQGQGRNRFSVDKLMIMCSQGDGSTKQIFFRDLNPERFIAVSADGTKIACMDCQNRLNVWSAHASAGCIPALHMLLADEGNSAVSSVVEKELNIYGPGIINCQDYNGLTPLMYAVYKKDVNLLKCLLSWAKNNDVRVSLRDELVGHDDQTEENQVLNALNLALGFRYPEVTRTIMKYLLEGVCTELETSVILKDSLVKLSGVYPSILLKILDNKRIMMRLHELPVPEWAFAKSEYKVVASNQLIPMPARLEEMWLKERLGKNESFFRSPGFKRTSAYACVMPYPEIAQVGMWGILRPLLFNKVPHHVFATWPIRCAIKFKWGQYGKRLIIEDCVHFAALLFFFTLYALLIGFVVDQPEDQSLRNKTFYNDGTVAVLTICVFLAFGLFMKKLHQIHVLWESGRWKGIWYWGTDYFNLLETICYIFIVCLVPLAHIKNVRSRLLATLVATSCIVLWAKTLYYAQAFKSTGPLVIMIREILKDIRFYLFLVFAILMGFAIAFFVLFRNARFEKCKEEESIPDDENGDAGECVAAQEINALFGSFDKTMITMFSMMLGEVSDAADLLFKVDTGLKIVGIAMFVVYLLAVTIVLLNLLIAIMGDGFDRVKATDMSYFLKKRAQIIDDMETGLTKERAAEISAGIGTYLHVLMPKHKSELHQQTGEWQGRARDAQTRFKAEVDKSFQQYAELLKSLKENQDRIERKLDEVMASNSVPYSSVRISSEVISSTPSRGHGGGRPMPLEEVSEGSDLDDLFGDASDADTV